MNPTGRPKSSKSVGPGFSHSTGREKSRATRARAVSNPAWQRLGAVQLITETKGEQIDDTARPLDDPKGQQARGTNHDQFLALTRGGELLAEGREKPLGSVLVRDV
jgi:alpha-D-ribose 1-methylphosphonate 5-triphosphate synthase subunit PhnG